MFKIAFLSESLFNWKDKYLEALFQCVIPGGGKLLYESV